VLRLLIMLETSLITVIYKTIGKFWYITHIKYAFVYTSLVEIPSNSIKFANKGVPLHLNTYTCKYQTATYLMRFSWVDIG
jgi:hypothetical protein